MVDQQSSPVSIMKEEIPFTCVSWGMYVKLANKLDPDGSVSNNWRMLAEKLGYNMQDIMVFESQQTPHGRNTIKVLVEYSQQSNSTVNALYRALQDIDRPDALEELKNGLSEIEKNYHESLQKKHHHQELQENEYVFTSCDDMAYTDDRYQAFPSSHQKQMPPPASKYTMAIHQGPHQAGLTSGMKCYQRQKSADMDLNRVDRRSNFASMYEHASPEFKRQRSLPISDSMVVRGHDNRSQYFRDHPEPMDHSPSLVDDPVPLPLGMMRAMGRYSGQSGYGGMSTAVHNKETTGYQSGFTRPKQAEMGLKLDIPTSVSDVLYSRQQHADFCSPGPTPTTTPSTPLGRLEKLANDRRYQPDEAYNDLMRMKQDEELLQNKIGNGGPFENQISPQRMGHVLSAYTSHSNEMLSQRAKGTDPPNTFPLRIKSTSRSTSSSSSVLLSSTQLTKSHSLPSNMKSAEYRKAFRHIKVLVTYAADDKKHTQRVLNLCQCLDKNGFTCCVDIFHRKLSVEERSTWCQNRFNEADFILCIISPKYRHEVDTCEMDDDADDSDSIDSDEGNDKDDRPHRLHTKHIYRLMYREYSQTGGQRCARFVPVLFQGMPDNLIPPWMVHAYSKLVYIWPKQYKDLLWMLTKPENRVPDHLLPSNERCVPRGAEDRELTQADLKLEPE